jgi:hypothetical protein
MIQHITVFAEVHICLLFGQPRTQGSQREPWVRGCFLTSFEQKLSCLASIGRFWLMLFQRYLAPSMHKVSRAQCNWYLGCCGVPASLFYKLFLFVCLFWVFCKKRSYKI